MSACFDRYTLPVCCEEHSVRFALLLTQVYAADYTAYLLKHEPPSGWRDEQQSALAFVQDRPDFKWQDRSK